MTGTVKQGISRWGNIAVRFIAACNLRNAADSGQAVSTKEQMQNASCILNFVSFVNHFENITQWSA